MATLTGQRIKDSYKDLLQVSNSNSGIDSTLRAVSDGEATSSLLQLSTAAVNISSAGTLQYAGVAITSTAAELNVLDGVTAGTVSASLGVVVDSDKDIGTFRNITLSGELDAGSLDVSGNADIDGTLEADAYTVDGTALATYIRDTVGTNMLSSNTESGITVTYDTSNDNIDFSVDAAQTGITSIYNSGLALGYGSSHANIDFSTDNAIIFDIDGTQQIKLIDGVLQPITDNDIDLGTSSVEFKDAYFDGTVTSDAFAGPLTGDVTGNVSGTAATVTTAAQTSITSLGTLTALQVDNLNINGNTISSTAGTDLLITPLSGQQIVLDGTIIIDAGVVTGATSVTSTAFVGDITGDVTGNADTATLATTVTITDNESTNENNAVIFTAGGDLDGGNLGLESDGDLYYNPSTGTLVATNISVSGTLTTVDSVTMNANNAVVFEGSAADAHETTLSSVNATADSTINLPNMAAGTYYLPVLAAVTTTAISSTPAELNVLDGVTAGTVAASLGVVVDSNKDIGTFRNITLSGELDAGSLDVSGNADIDGTLEADAITVDGTTLAEYIADTAGAMVSSNTESGITVAYQDGDNTIDFSVDAAQTGITSIYATDLILGEDSQTAIDFGTANEIDFKINNATELTLDASALYPVSDAGLDLGTSSLEFKDAFFDGTVTSDAFAGPLTGDVTGNVSGTAATVTTAAQSAITSLGTLTTLTVDNININGSTLTNSSGALTIVNTVDDEDIIIQSDDGSGGVANYMVFDGGSAITTVHKIMRFDDSIDLRLGAGSDLRLYHNGTNSYVDNYTGDLYIRNTVDDGDIIFQSDDASGGNATYLTINGGASLVDFAKATRHADSVIAYFGGGLDGRIYHNGSNFYIANTTTGDLYIQNELDDKDIILRSDDGSGGVTAYLTLDGSAETVLLEKPTTVTGFLTIDDAGDANEGGEIIINPGTSHSAIWKIDSFYGHLRIFNTTTAGEQLRITEGGDLAQLTGTKHYFDGVGHTYIQEVSADTMVFVTGGTEHFRIASDGTLTGTDTSIGSNSDLRLKENVKDFNSGLDIISKLQPKTFNFKNQTEHLAGTRRGFIAQEVKAVDDYWIDEVEIKESNPDYKYVEDTKGQSFVSKLNDKDAMYVSAIQELKQEIDELKLKIGE